MMTMKQLESPGHHDTGYELVSTGKMTIGDGSYIRQQYHKASPSGTPPVVPAEKMALLLFLPGGFGGCPQSGPLTWNRDMGLQGQGKEAPMPARYRRTGQEQPAHRDLSHHPEASQEVTKTAKSVEAAVSRRPPLVTEWEDLRAAVGRNREDP